MFHRQRSKTAAWRYTEDNIFTLGETSATFQSFTFWATRFKTTDAAFVVNKGLFISTAVVVAAGGGEICAVGCYEWG